MGVGDGVGDGVAVEDGVGLNVDVGGGVGEAGGELDSVWPMLIVADGCISVGAGWVEP